MNAVGNKGWNVGKSLTVLPGTVLGDIKGVNRGWRGEVAAVEAEGNTSIGHVCFVAIGGDGNAVRKGEVIRDDGDSTSLEVVAVHLVSQTGNRSEILEVAVESVGEVKITVLWANDQIIEGVELATKVVIDKSWSNKPKSDTGA